MSETKEANSGKAGPSQSSTRLYVLIAAALVVVIVVAGILLITKGLPALRKGEEPTSVSEAKPAPSLAPTFTPGPTREPTSTLPPAPPPTAEPPVMLDTDAPAFDFQSAGARPGVDWTGFFGQVLDSDGNPIAGASLIIWYRDGTPASDIAKTDANGNYEIRLADTPLSGSWSIQVLTADGKPASKLFTFNTDEDTKAGVQQIQVLWEKVP